MPEHIRALVYILVTATLVFKFSAPAATSVAMTREAFVSRRNTWYLITLAAFLSHNVWVFFAILAFLLHRAAKKETNKIALFFFLVVALPELKTAVPGFAGVNYFIEINYFRVLVWVLLIPIFWQLCIKSKKREFTWNFVDYMLAIYFLINMLLEYKYVIFTEWLRFFLGWMFDIVIPYVAISRSVRNIKDFREVIMAFLIAAMILSALGVIEFFKQWLLYASLSDVLGADFGADYLGRGGNLRSLVTTGQPIVMGYVLAIAIGFYGYMKRSVANVKLYFLGMLLLLAGEISPLSKGPWVGMTAAVIVYTLLGGKALSRLSKIVLSVLFLFVVLSFTDYGETVSSYLPFIGNLDEGSMNYRTMVIQRSLDVIYMNPYFGSNDYLLYLEDLRQGQGIIDIVNDYIQVALSCGLVGLAVFLLIFVGIFWRIFARMRAVPLISEEHELGQALIGIFVGIMIMLSSVSEIAYVPILLWCSAALATAYSGMRFQVNGKTV